MSWYSDGTPFDEYDPPWCHNCPGGDSYEQCKGCEERHLEEKDDGEEEDEDDELVFTQNFDLCGYEEDDE